MKETRNILVAFFLNLFFSIFEFFGGIWTGSVAILSDALHDLGDAASIGVSYYLERKSKKKPDRTHTYGYGRYSVLGSLVTTLILILGSVGVMIGAVQRLFNPTPIHYDGMILFALVGVAVNGAATFFTREGGSLNQKAVNLHMLEDVLGWAVVLIGALVIKWTDFPLLDPLLSIGTSLFIFTEAAKTGKESLDLFLEKAPCGICPEELTEHLLQIDGVQDIHHLHLWSLDGQRHFATLHAVVEGDEHPIKDAIREELAEHGICHVTIETEADGKECHHKDCHILPLSHSGHHHHHHHHHH